MVRGVQSLSACMFRVLLHVSQKIVVRFVACFLYCFSCVFRMSAEVGFLGCASLPTGES